MQAYVKGVVKELDLIRRDCIRLVSSITAKELVRYAAWSHDVIEVVINSLVELIRSFQITSFVLRVLVAFRAIDVRAVLVYEVACRYFDNRRASSVYLAAPEDEM